MKNKFLINLIRDESGTSAVELGMICALIVLAMLSALQGFANTNSAIWGKINSKVAESNKNAKSN
jgi:pilus assembly protein Flp/PilA